MIKIGITGSLASGKSTVAKLMSRGRYPIFSADKLVGYIYKKKIFLVKTKRKFNFDNTINLKQKLKNLITKNKKALKQLEQIIHPLVRKEMRSFINKKKKTKIKIFEIPLLIESKLTKYFDIIVFVGAKKNIRLKRYISAGGNKKIFTIFEKRQTKPSKKIKISDHVIYNNKKIKNLEKNVSFLMRRYE